MKALDIRYSYSKINAEADPWLASLHETSLRGYESSTTTTS